jgi:hypothetical protein
MIRYVCAAVLATAISVLPAGAATQVTSASAANLGGSEPFRVVTGIPAALKRDGRTSVGDGALASNTIYAFPEKQGVTLTAPLDTGNAIVPKGTKVDSWYVCIDTDRRAADPGPRGGTDYSARLAFNNNALLAMVLRPAHLKTSARALGLPGVTYVHSRFVGVDPFWMGQDGQWFDGRNFLMRGNANGIDCMRLVFRAK